MASSVSSRKAYYATAVAVTAILPIIIGVVATLSPPLGLTILSFPPPARTSSPQDIATIYGLSRLFGTRDFSLGSSSLFVWYFGGAREGKREGCTALACMMFAGVVLVIVDGIVSVEVIGGGSWNHWAFAPVGVVLGAGLLGWM